MRDLLPNPYLLGLGVGLLSYILIWGLKALLSMRLGKFTGLAKNSWDEVVVFLAEKTTQPFMFLSAVYAGFRFIKHTKIVNLYADRIYFVVFMWQVAIWSYHLLDKWISSQIKRKTLRNPSAASSISLIQLLARFILFSILFLFTLSNLGIQITTIIAGLGVGGIAVALALQKILGDLFASLSIVLDKPFVVGDFIIVDQYLGEVEKIGLKTTRIRSLSGEQIIISNSDLLGTRIRNFKRMHERRIPLLLFLPLNLSTNKLRTAVSLITAIIRTKNMVRFERCHFMEISNYTKIETIYWVLSDDYNIYMDIHQEILIEIKEAFEAEKISFAYPTQNIHVAPTEILMMNPFNEGTAGKKSDNVSSIN